MSVRRQFAMLIALLLIVITPLLAGCGATATPTTVPTVAPTVAPTKALPTATKAPPTATTVPPTATPQGPTVGGTMVIVPATEPPTLDAQVSASGADVMFFGSTLVAKDPDTGTFVPYLADSWTTSTDGLTWTFKLKKGVKFHDGSPLTAADYAWTFQRAVDPATKSVGAKGALGTFAGAKAVDDSTLQITLKAPYYPFLDSLSLPFLQPLSQAAVTKAGDAFGRSPVGVGPYVFKSWQTGSKIVFERNPDFAWAPSYAKNKGAFYIQTIEFRYIPEYSTAAAGLEAGQIDFYSPGVRAADLARIQATGKFQTFESITQGASPYVCMNVSKPPFDDVLVRQAFNYAIDHDGMIKAAAQGNAVAQYGPISPSTGGYDKTVEQTGYHLDLAKAKSLMQQAGYTYGSDGMLVGRDGKPLALTLLVSGYTKAGVAEVVQGQYKALGVSLTIKQVEIATAMPTFAKGDFQIAMSLCNYDDVEVLVIFFRSTAIGSMNFGQVNDPQLDKLLDATRSTLDAAARQLASNALQQYMIQKAYMVPLYAEKTFYPVSSRIQGVKFSKFNSGISALVLNDAYIAK